MRWALLVLICAAAATAQRVVTLADVAAPDPGISAKIRWSPSGDRFALDDNGSLVVYDVPLKKKREVLAITRLESAATQKSPPSATAWTNRHVSQSELQWFPDNRHLLASVGGDLFIVDSEKGSFENLLKSPQNAEDAKLSPDGKHVSFRRSHDLYSLDVARKSVVRLTADGSDTLLNGEPDWVYPEELELTTAHWWSPDSASIAYLQFDVSHEPLYPQVSSSGIAEPQRYPKPGDPNAVVRLGVVPASGGATRWMDLGPLSDLVARVVWSPNSHELLAVRLNRIQNRLDIMLADAQTGAAHSIVKEEDPFWINLRGEPVFTGTGDRFLWTSERSGYRHIYLYGIDGHQQTQLTSGNWEASEIAAASAQQVFYISSESGPLERQLYAINLTGGERKRISTVPGTHEISLSSNDRYYVDDASDSQTPLKTSIRKSDGTLIAEYGDPVAETPELQTVETVTVRKPDSTILYAHLIRPIGFDPSKKYPAVVIVYGGPDVQVIRNSWEGVTWAQALAARGFVVWEMDGRGSAGRGHLFETPIFHNLGASEMADQKAGIAYLIAMGFVDEKRIGMYGWSYGGFLTLYAVTHEPALLRAAIAGAPVTDWRTYDSIYTERYMGLPADNTAAYIASSPVISAAAMGETRLLLVHNMEDDNVHFQNSMQMAEALENSGRLFSMAVYPQKTHGVTGAAHLQMLNQMTQFFEDALR